MTLRVNEIIGELVDLWPSMDEVRAFGDEMLVV